MTPQQRIADAGVQIREVRERLAALDEQMSTVDTSTEGGRQRFENLWRGHSKASAELGRLTNEYEQAQEQVQTDLRDGLARGLYATESGGNDLGPDGAGFVPAVRDLRGTALRAIERSGAPDDGKQRITVALESASGEEQSRLSRWASATADPAYLRAFIKLARDPQSGHYEWTPQERDAFQKVQSEARAMSLTDSAGGYLVPFQLDPAVILTSSGVASPVRQLARKVVATGDVWNGNSSAGVSVSFDAEADEVSDDSPTLGQPTVTIRTMRGFVPISIEAFEDEQNVAATVAELLTDAANTLEGEKFVLGVAASNEPVGLVTALIAAGGASVVAQAGATLDPADFFAVQQALPSRFQPNASWLMHLASLNRARQVIAGTGLTTPMLDDSQNPPRLLGKPAYETSPMDDTVTAAAADYLAIYGDIAKAYVVADRVGTTIEFIPHLFGANRRPTGQRGWVMYRRVGGNLVNASAARLLNKSA